MRRQSSRRRRKYAAFDRLQPGNETIVEALLRHSDIDVDRGMLQIPLHAAAAIGSYAIVERLINAGCDVNKVSR